MLHYKIYLHIVNISTEVRLNNSIGMLPEIKLTPKIKDKMKTISREKEENTVTMQV